MPQESLHTPSSQEFASNVTEQAGSLSPEQKLSQGLAGELYATAVNLGERTLPIATEPQYTNLPYYELPSQVINGVSAVRQLSAKSFSFNPDYRGVNYTITTDGSMRTVTIRTSPDSPRGSFRLETEVMNGGDASVFGLDYTAPDANANTAESSIFFDTAIMTPDQTHVPVDDPRREDILNRLLVDAAMTKDAVAEFEALELTAAH